MLNFQLKQSQRIAISLAVLFLLPIIASCTEKISSSQQKQQSTKLMKEYTLSGKTMGTTYSVKVVTSEFQLENNLKILKNSIDQKLVKINQQMSTYIKDSDLSLFNKFKKINTPFSISQEFIEVMTLSSHLNIISEGAFDVTIGPIIQLWGFDKGKYSQRSKIPSKTEIENTKTYIGGDKISILKNNSISKKMAKTYVNLSAIAKGYAVDQISQLLDLAKFSNYMVEIGGEVYAKGQNINKKYWTLGINTPSALAKNTDAIEIVSLNNRALATSGNYRNFFEENGERFGHIIDPRTFYPVSHHLLSVSIIAKNCALADGLATTAMVLGEQHMRSLLKKHYPEASALFIYADKSTKSGYKISKTQYFNQNIKD